MYIPAMNVPHKLLKHLAYSFDLSHSRLYTRCGIINITQENIAAALGLSISGPLYPAKINFQELSEEDKELVRSFQGKTLSQLSTSMMEMNVDGGEKLDEIQEDIHPIYSDVLLVADSGKQTFSSSHASHYSRGRNMSTKLGWSCAQLLNKWH
ncbi:hypothetical protein AHAS_Ahas09G0179200 [Arachis hypogaea]